MTFELNYWHVIDIDFKFYFIHQLLRHFNGHNAFPVVCLLLHRSTFFLLRRRRILYFFLFSLPIFTFLHSTFIFTTFFCIPYLLLTTECLVQDESCSTSALFAVQHTTEREKCFQWKAEKILTWTSLKRKERENETLRAADEKIPSVRYTSEISLVIRALKLCGF